MNSIRIYYIGKKQVKKDTVGGNTGAIWFGFGHYQEIPETLAGKFLMCPDVWVTEKEFEKKFGQGTSGETGLSDAPQPPAQVNEPSGAPSEPPTPKEPDSNAESSSPSGNQSIQDAVKAILNTGDPDLLTESGKPKLEAVRKLAGEDVAVKDLNAAVKEVMGE